LSDEQTPLARARAIALRSLAARARTEAWVRARLDRAGLGDVAGEVVDWLRGLGYLDDPSFARARARSLLAPGRLGPRAAERRLVSAGIPPPLAGEAVRSALGEAAPAGATDPEAALCRALAERRAGSTDLASLDDRTRRRLARFLLGRGFAGPVVARVLGVWADSDG
jgi:regulatory protein